MTKAELDKVIVRSFPIYELLQIRIEGHRYPRRTLDSENTLFLVGRCKSMLLASNGQNVYPEEIEVKLNVLPYVAESIIVQRGEKFVALVVPNADQLANDGVSSETFKHLMEKNIATLNSQIPAYSFVSDYELREEPFAKTPKGSIKRFMYS